MSIAPPIFVVGCMRSGTTILREMLARYFPAAVDLDDSDFEGRTFWQSRGFNIGSPRTGTPCDAYDGAAVSDAQKSEMRAHVRQREGGARHIINKNPHLSNKIGLVNAVFPEARIVHLVRDDLATAASTKLRLLATYEGQNVHKAPFIHYWPDEATWPCWSCIASGPASFAEQPLALRLRRLLLKRRTPMFRHEHAVEFGRLHPDPSRYYPGAGFRRIPEYWLRVNSNIVRQVEAAVIKDRYLPLNYTDLVTRTRETLERIAAFADIDGAARGDVPLSLDGSRQEKWRRDLTDEEQACVAAVTEELAADASLIRESLPGPLFTRRC
jgi:hypothetical protein